MIRLLTLEVK